MHKRRAIPEPSALRKTSSQILRMKVIVCSIVLLADIFAMRTTAGFAQDAASLDRLHAYSTVRPLTDVSPEALQAPSGTGASIPLWNFSVTSPLDNHVYAGTMVGRSPFFHGARTTNVPAIVVPVIIKFSDGTVFDPTAADSSCSPAGTPLNLTENSPIFTPVDITMDGVDMGTTQYADAFQRANFWTQLSATGNRYHTLLSPVTVLPAITMNVPAADGSVFSTTQFGGCGGIIGVMNINWFDPQVKAAITNLSGNGVGPATLPIFILKNVAMVSGTPTLDGSCCILSYHGAYGSPLQTYTPFDYDTSGIFISVADINPLSHEIGEWMDDPTGTNPTPAWGHTGQVTGCQSNLEVGDPLSDNEFSPLLAPNGFTYHPQELAFFSWFFRQTPSIGVNGMYSDDETFAQDAGAACM
jgi:hypothetical protein